MMKAKDALSLGVVDAVYEPADFLEKSVAFTASVLSGSTKTSSRSRRTWRGHKLFSISKKSDVILVRVSDRAGTYASYIQ
jgi:enoyl-CoA hydratase/carnithine racemase